MTANMHQAGTMTSIGTSPFSRKAMLNALEEFMKLYEQRPIKDNTGGMKSPHMFAMWHVLKTLNPSAVIESGVFKGLGTWFIEQACPDAKLYCIEPHSKRIVYHSMLGTYYCQDFSTWNWETVDKGKTALFFDDHQNCVERVMQAKQLGFKHLLFEDNYPSGQGDCHSLKHALSYKNPDSDYLHDVLNVYEELPPVFVTDRTRWNTAWSEIPTPDPLLRTVEQPYQQLFLDEATDYTWMCYARLT